MILLVLIVTLFEPVYAEREGKVDSVTEPTANEYVKKNFPADWKPAKPPPSALSELDCIQGKGTKGEDLITSAAAQKNIAHLAPFLDAAMAKYDIRALERAQFYSQAIDETGGFTSITEDSSYSNPASDSIGHLARAAVSDQHFKAVKGAKRSKQFGDYRGRGLVQISRCDNYFSVLHFMQLIDRREPPIWKGEWKYSDGRRARWYFGVETVGIPLTPLRVLIL